MINTVIVFYAPVTESFVEMLFKLVPALATLDFHKLTTISSPDVNKFSKSMFTVNNVEW